jgi:hypothetical protein
MGQGGKNDNRAGDFLCLVDVSQWVNNPYSVENQIGWLLDLCMFCICLRLNVKTCCLAGLGKQRVGCRGKIAQFSLFNRVKWEISERGRIRTLCVRRTFNQNAGQTKNVLAAKHRTFGLKGQSHQNASPIQLPACYTWSFGQLKKQVHWLHF